MFAIIGAILFGIIAIITLLVAFGAPFGEYVLGGQNKILPVNYRVVALITCAIQVFGIFTILQAGGYYMMWFSPDMTRIICFAFAAYITVNIILNLMSKSKKEKYVMNPISVLAAICYWITAFQMQL